MPSSGEIWNYACIFTVEVFFAICESYCEVVLSFMCDRRCFHHIEMFSVVKLKKSFWSAAGCAGYYFAFMHFLTRVGKYNNICSESFLNLFRCCSFRV